MPANAEVGAGLAAGLVIARLRAGRPDVWVPLAIAITVVVEEALKLALPQPPPPPELARSIALVPTIVLPVHFSFPSGHTARLAFLLLIAHGIPRSLTAATLALVGLSRVYLGEHWPTDVLGGLLLGAAVAWLARRDTKMGPAPFIPGAYA